MDIKAISKQYDVRTIEEKDVATVFQLCEKNTQYYVYYPPMVTMDGLRADLQDLPPGKTLEDKFYVGLYKEDELVAVMDLILQYPNAETVFVGFFMMDKKWQGKRVGSSIIQELCNYFMKDYSFIRLAYVEGNKQAEGFWVKNGFHPTGDKKSTEAYTVIVMQKEL